MEREEILNNMIVSAQNELSSIKAKHILNQVINDAQKELSYFPNSKIYLILSKAYTDLSNLENDYEKRLSLRRKAIKICSQGLSFENSTDLAIAFADCTVSHFYDQFVPEDASKMRLYLIDAKRFIDDALKTEKLPHNRFLLLTNRSSLLRCQAKNSKDNNNEKLSLEAVRCAEKAIKESENASGAHLELGQALWCASRFSKSDHDYFERMNKAEEEILIAKNSGIVLAELVLARFYRQTYRGMKAIESFLSYEKHELNRRRVLVESYLLAESTFQIWYSNYPNEYVKKNLEIASYLLHEAIDAGYQNSRIIVSLAFLEASKGKIELSEKILLKIGKEIKSSSWFELINDAVQAIQNDNIGLLQRAFALGVSDGIVWNALGTYALEFLKDEKLSKQLYEIGLRLDPTNPRILTNLSRILITLKDAESIDLADKYLNKASKNADRSFIWWRGVLNDLKKIQKSFQPVVKEIHNFQDTIHINSFPNFKDLQKEYKKLCSGEIPITKKGIYFQKLIENLLRLSFGKMVMGEFKQNGRKIDAAFKLKDDYYRVEVKCKDKKCGPESIDQLSALLSITQVRGIMISYSGFTEGAVTAAKNIMNQKLIILIDKDEIDDIFNSKNRFDILLDKKLSGCYFHGDPYYKENSRREIPD